MWELDHKEDRVPKDWCFWTVVLKTLESSLDCKEIKPVNPKGNQSWIFIGRTEAEAQTPILWPPDAKTWFTGKNSDAGEDWGQQEKGTTGQDCWMVLSTQWTGVWVSSKRWWRIGKPGVLQSTGSKRVRHDWVTEQHWDTQRLATAWGSHMGSLTAEHIIFIILYATACPPTYEPYLSLSSS